MEAYEFTHPDDAAALKALEYMEKVLAIDEKRYDSNHPRIAYDLMNIASMKASVGDDSFKNDFHRALQIYIIRYGEDSKLLAEAYLQIAQAYLSVKQYEDAKAYYEKSYSIYSSDGLSMEDVSICPSWRYIMRKLK